MSIYIHIPFCSSICTYCDFCKMYYNKKFIKDYLITLEKEIKERYQGEKVRTIFIGGGTPTSLDESELTKLLEITKIFNKEDNIEFTIESNVESLTEEKLKIMKKYGVNRLSIGVQSFNEQILKILGRNHTREDIYNKINIAKKYFDNINIDLIYAVTNDINKVKEDLKEFLKLDITHISTYSLIIEDKTILKINDHQNIDEDIDYQMYKIIEEILEENNYIHYEVSNYAKKNYQSKHNLVYWNNEEYYGFGLGSTSYLKNERRTNTKNLTKYLNDNYIDESDYESVETRMENEIMLGLRKLEGINLDTFKEKYHISLEEKYNIEKLLQEKHLIKENNYLKINKEYIYISNEILLKILS